MLQRRHFQKSQYGQGMVEYAILLILTVTLVIGGIELASATLASGKASNAAEAGAGDLAAINEVRLKAQQNQQKYLRQLDYLYNAGVVQVNENGLLVASEAMDPEETDTPITTYDDYVRFLDSFAKDYIELDLADGDTLTTELTEEYLVFFNDLEDGSTEADFKNILLSGTNPAGTNYAELEEIFDKINGINDPNGDGIVDTTDREVDEEVDYSELIQAIKNTTGIDTDDDGDIDEQFNLISAVVNLNPTADGTTDEEVLAFKTARLKTLMLIEEIQLSMLPLDPRVTRDNGLSESTILIGNHIPDYVANTSAFQRPACSVDGVSGDFEYTTGFPGVDDADGLAKTTVELEDGVIIDAPAVYLFNPLPVDAVSCQGNDAVRGGRSRMSILMGGHGKEGEENYFSGLPKLNQAFYGQYTRVCLNNANEYVACGKANVAQELLKPPGKFCLSNVATAGVDSCPGIEDDHIETSGYYFWGFPSGRDKFKWIYDRNEAPEFRPTMQLTCNSQTVDSDEDDVRQYIASESCDPTLSDEPVKTVRINVRYRSVFESFLTFGLMELTNPNGIANLADYFYDPSNLRSLGNGNIGVPVAGSELGPKSANKNPSVKNFKDFRGCFDINLETNQVTSCN